MHLSVIPMLEVSYGVFVLFVSQLHNPIYSFQTIRNYTKKLEKIIWLTDYDVYSEPNGHATQLRTVAEI